MQSLRHTRKRLTLKRTGKSSCYFLFNSLSNGDSATAYKYVWSGENLNIRNAEIPQIYKDSKVLEVLKVRYDSAKNRPDYYQQFYKMISLTIKIKTVHADLAGNPAGTYIVFVTVVKKIQNLIGSLLSWAVELNWNNKIFSQ